MVRILGFYLMGVGLHQLTKQSVSTPTVWMATVLCTGLFFISQQKIFRRWSGLFGLLSIIGMGWIGTAQFDQSKKPDHLIHHQQPIKAYIAAAIEPPEKTSFGFRCLMEIKVIYHQKEWIARRTKSLTYFKEKPSFKHGHILLIKGSPHLIKEKNEHRKFNYTEYLKRKNIFFRHYTNSEGLQIIGIQPKTLYHYAVDLRRWCVDQINAFVTGKNERAIAAALLVGQSEDLDPELNQHYAATGTLHVLSVSGLHTGLLYWIILMLSKPLKKVRGGNVMISGLTIVLLWSYAMITGLSPSVLRAVVMFTLMTVASPFGLRSNMYNTLAGSAFLLLLFDPWLITRIGFQLSYLAVLGIVWLHPLILRLWEPNSRIVFSGWNLTSVSIAAQLTTMPVSLLNFQQLPAWFIPANLIIIPLSSLALFVGLAFLPLSLIPNVASIAGWVLSKLITLMNYVTTEIGRLPLGPFENIAIHIEQALALAVLLVASERFLTTRNRSWMLILLFTAFLFGLSDLLRTAMHK